MPIIEETGVTVLVYDSGQVVEVLPPITIYENGQATIFKPITRTEMDDGTVIVGVAG
jgi:hypothetical protein